MDLPKYIEQIKKIWYYERLRVGQKAQSESTRGPLASPRQESGESHGLHPFLGSAMAAILPAQEAVLENQADDMITQ